LWNQEKSIKSLNKYTQDLAIYSCFLAKLPSFSKSGRKLYKAL